MIKPLDPKIKKEWEEFHKWIHKAHNITPGWRADYSSVSLWEEYKASKRRKK